jgi:hypothetical protein
MNMNITIHRNIIKNSLMAAFAIIIFLALLAFTVPTSIGLNARYGYLVPLIFTILFAFFLSLNNSRGLLLSLSSMLILFALPLSALWTTGLSNEFIIGGLLPFSDAAGYYNDANRLLEGGVFSEFSTRRPLFAGLLAVLLWITGGDLKLTIAILVLITALAVYLTTLQVWKSMGTAPSALFMLICFLFYRSFIGTTLTEHLGLTLGLLGFALLWLSVVEKRVSAAFSGIVLLTLALNARAGAFFVLPLLTLWMVIYFRDDTFSSYRILLVASACVLFGFATNYLLLSVVGSPNGGAFSNFSYVLYGLVFGGDWTTAINNPPPEVIGLTGKALTDKLYQITISAVIKDPSLLISGMLSAWKEQILKGYTFNFVITDHSSPGISSWFYSKQVIATSKIVAHLIALAIVAALHILSLAGTYWSYRNRKKEGSIIIAILVGLFFSIPFIPPWDSDFGRVYAATIPLLAIVPSCGLNTILSTLKKRRSYHRDEIGDDGQKYNMNATLLYLFPLLPLICCTVGPIALKLTRTQSTSIEVECPQGMEPLNLRMQSGSYIMLSDDAKLRTAVPRVLIKDFTGNLELLSYYNPDIVNEFKQISSPNYLFLNEKGYSFIDSKYSTNASSFRLCGKKKEVKPMNIYYVN